MGLCFGDVSNGGDQRALLMDIGRGFDKLVVDSLLVYVCPCHRVQSPAL